MVSQGGGAGDTNAQVKVGAASYWGKGVSKDYIQARKGYNLAASKATCETREGAAKSRAAEARKLAREWQAEFEKRQKK